MSSVSQVDDLVRHMAWADAAVWQTVLRLDAAREDERLLGWLHHIHVVQRAFLSVWRGQPPAIPKPTEFPQPRELARWGREGHVLLRAFVDDLAPSRLDDIVVLPWADRFAPTPGTPPGSTTLRETMVQVALHSTHHRGQVAARVRELGGEPPLCDYIAWLWHHRPPADWSAVDDEA